MKLIADENIPLKVVEDLKGQGYDVLRVDEIKPGLKDPDVIDIAIKESRILVTFDKDFGELIYRHGYKVEGVILLRFLPINVNFIAGRLLSLLDSGIEVRGNFIVVEEKRIRVRKLILR